MCRTEVYGNIVTAQEGTTFSVPPGTSIKCDDAHKMIKDDTINPPLYSVKNGECIIDPISGWSTKQRDEDKKKRRKRLLPITEVGGTGTWEDGVDRENLAFIPPFENTKHRYPWICSLRYVISKVLKFNSLILILLIGQSLITLISVAPPS